MAENSKSLTVAIEFSVGPFSATISWTELLKEVRIPRSLLRWRIILLYEI